MKLENIKNLIKNNYLLQILYIKIQSLLIYLQYKVLTLFYKNKRQNFTFKELLLKKGFDQKWKQKFEVNKKPVVFFVGNDEYQDKSGFIQELEKVCSRVYLFEKEDGTYGTYHFGSFNYQLNSTKNKAVILNTLSRIDKTLFPDILMLQAWGWNLIPEDLHEIRLKYPTLKVINICMDDRHSFWFYGSKKLGTAGLLPYVDLVLSTSSETVEWCLKENTPALFFPLGSSMDFYYPMKVEKKFEVGFVGAKYGIREEIVKALIAADVNVKAYGKGWASGKLPLEETNAFFNQCELILGIGTIAGCRNFYNMKLRDFDALMSGGAYITHNNKDLKLLFGDSVILCDTTQEFIKKVKYYLKNKEKLQTIRESGYRVVKNYTYEKNFLKVFNILGIR